MGRKGRNPGIREWKKVAENGSGISNLTGYRRKQFQEEEPEVKNGIHNTK